ncbi:MAG TPA: LamG domain-containing protein [Pirellulales bacterium]|nr:LamG domain-containing protein [Pirellulales bacterium]
MLGDKLDLPVDLYFNASDLRQGTDQILALARGPQEAPVYTLYGGLSFDFGNLLDTVKKDVSSAGALGPQLGTAIQLDGTDQYATAPNIDLNNQSFTAEFWAQRQDNGRAQTVLSENNGIQIGFDVNDDFTFSDGGATILSYVKPDNLWHDYAVSFDDTTGAVVFYVDGVEVEQGTLSPASLAQADTTLYMGSQPGGGGFFNGSLDEVRISNVVRSTSDIVNNMDAPLVDPDSLKQLLGYWQFEDGSGTTASDSSLNGNTAQLVGNPQWIEANANMLSPVTVGSFNVKFSGGLDVTAPVVGGVHIVGTASFTVLPDTSAVDMDVTGSLNIDPLGNLLNVTGSTHLEFDTQTEPDGTQQVVPNLWGAFELKPGDLSSLAQLGLDVSGTALLRFNTDTTAHSITLPNVATAVDLPATSLQFYVDGSADFQQAGTDWFHVDGTVIASFVVTGSTTQTLTDSNGNPIDDLNGNPLQVTYENFMLDTLVDGTLVVGPTSSPLAKFSVDGFMQIADSGPDAGMAAQIAM